MKIRSRLIWLCVAVLMVIAAGAAPGQIMSSSTSYSGSSFTAKMTYQPPPFPMATIANAPYSGERVSEHFQVLADGTRISESHPMEREYRDSAGRTRTERAFMMGRNAPADVPYMVDIRDPLSRYEYILDPQNHVAYRYAVPESAQRMIPPPPAPPAGSAGGAGSGSAGVVRPATPRPNGQAIVNGVPVASDVEQLGTQTFDGGIVAEGTRRTMTYPVGFQGNDRPINVIMETWTVPDLRIAILSKNIDPRSGENVNRFQNLSRGEPDPSLFQPPPDYRIVDQTGPVTITYTRP